MAVPPYGRPINTSVVVSPLLHPKTVLIPLLVSELEPQNYFQGGTANVGDSEFLLINPSKLDTRVKNEYVLKKSAHFIEIGLGILPYVAKKWAG